MGDNWKTQAKKIAEVGYSVHLIDQRNHGKSFWSNKFNYELMVEDLRYYLSYYAIKNAILMGHSMGGKISMKFALKYPEHINQLIIVDIAPKYYKPNHQNFLEALISLNLETIRSRKEAEEKLSCKIKNSGILKFLLKNLYWTKDGKLGLRINIEVLQAKEHEIGKAVYSNKTFKKPCLFIIGADSKYVDKNLDFNMVTKYFPIAEIIEIKSAGHWPHAEKPDDFFFELMTRLD